MVWSKYEFWSKYEYCMNALFYTLWRWEVKVGKLIVNTLNYLYYLLLVVLKRANYLTRVNLESHFKKGDIYNTFFGLENSISISFAIRKFGFLSSCYYGFISFALFGIISISIGDIGRWGNMIIFIVPVLLGYNLSLNAVYFKKRYIIFFKEFNQRSPAWHRKWNYLTMLFSIVAIVVFIMGCFVLVIANLSHR